MRGLILCPLNIRPEAAVIIAVIGASQPSEKTARLARQVGAELGRRGVTLVCGGLGGVMEAACRGAKSTGGETVGILPGSDPSDANCWVDIRICTGMGYARNAIVVKSGRAVIAVGGAYGTLSEIGHALGEDVPVVALDTWELARGGVADDSMIAASNPTEAVELAIRAAELRDGHGESSP